ncbi:helix-turn-helix domain-containing protein [Sulfuricurvum sp.]|uniref:excisionase family DNA-binding protein n=1 Tax=Sulfuricurvum sp. TaxID=2025608 RepID=UPI002639C78C|nr:helix-turn-helix domain-containing protein [Sulfuricurvum sp.]MDD2265702.1 helix-turn-helix domain-containing protein [Sulfuricurvum sp.]MDD2784009.1 helix-turn-helix domain-containing protein [Sulfuricurvum sp.]
MTKRLQTIQEASEHTGLLVSFLRKMIFDRSIPFIKIGKRVYFDRDELNAWIDSHKVAA